MDEWIPAHDSASRDGGGLGASGSGGLASDDPGESGLFGADADEFAFLRDEEALPSSETKFKDALIFLLDCSALMHFPADEEDLREMQDEGKIKVKPEASTIGTASTPHSAAHHSHDSPAAAAASSSASPSPSPAAAAGARSPLDPSLAAYTQFQMVLRVVLHSIRQKIISSPDDFVGVVLFGARETQNPNGFGHIYIHTPLQNLTAAAIRKLDGLMDADEFAANIGSLSEREVSSKVEMDKILWICSSMFTDAAVSNTHKRVLLLTNNDTPFNTADPLSRMRAVQKGKDLRDLDIGIDLIAVAKGTGKAFNPSLFFQDILICGEDESLDLTASFRNKYADLKEQLFKKQMKKRALGSVPLQLGAGVNIGVKIFCMLRETRKESAVFLDSETNERLDTQTRYLDTNTGAVLQPHEIQKYYPYGGAKVVLSDDELKQLKEIGTPGLVLMGFKPYDALRVSHNYKNPYFIYPDDGQFTDSSKAFKALLLAMHELKQVAICRLIYRRGSIPRFVALMPQMAKIDPDGEVVQPPGLNLIFLPYADDIRKLRFEPTPIAPDELITEAKKTVAKLSTKSLTRMTNPVLQKHYRVIQAIALDEPPPEEGEIEDLLQPDAEGMAKHAKLVQAFIGMARSIGQDAQADAEPPASRKRKVGPDGEEAPKRPKKEDVDYADIDWQQELANDTLKKLTVPTLKVYCRQHKLPLAGSKADLLERVTAALFA